MERRDFLKNACGAGLCACAIGALFSSNAEAEEPKPAAGAAPTRATEPKEDPRVRFAQDRYAKLLTALGAKVPAETLGGALEEVGDYCASSSKIVSPFAGKPQEFLATMCEKWHAEVTHDEAAGVVMVAFPAMKACPCGLVRVGVTPPTVCQCSIGWQRRAFSTVFGRPVRVELKQSLLRGSDRCRFEIRLA
jgi:predicted hydrocarbon binding protein